MPPRLKSLELHGYKTFASRTEFQFPVMITAIVGPNGSGKSNIADALRWVLGEQSYSLLRGRKTEDMIFSGSEQRSRAGMASATITFDNEDGWLPVDFSEVAITRRAYRDGNNEYLLNGQRIRLREIHELLGQSGLAERTYTIIGQGLVDAALALKPEERRRLFEEAAGIGLYRMRREEAINRLEATRRNLERVQDILVELEPRLRSLEKQARRAMEYERLRSDLQGLLRDWYGYHWHQLQRELAHAREVYHAQESRLAQAQKRYEEVSLEVQEFRKQINQIRDCLSAWYGESSEIHRSREQVSKELAILEERHRAFQEQRQSHFADIGRIEDEITGSKERIARLEAEKGRLSSELEDARKQAQASKIAHQERLAQRNAAERAVREARQRLVAAETRQVQRKAHLDELNNRLNNHIRTLENAQVSIHNKQAEHENAQTRLQEAENIRTKSIQERFQAQSELAEFQQKVSNLETEHKQVTSAKSKLDSEYTRMRIQLDAIAQAEKTYMGMAEGAKTLLQAAQQGQIPGKFTSFNSLIEVPPEYEAAVAAALGEYFDLLLLDSGVDPEHALGMLENSQKGRAALFPLEWVDHAGYPKAPVRQGCLGTAANLVSASESIRPAVDLLLGHTLVVTDRSVAREILKAAPAFTRAVTLKGEVFAVNGAILAGRETRGGLLSRPRQKRELSQAISNLQDQIQNLDNQLEKLEGLQVEARNQASHQEKMVRQANQQAENAAEQFQAAKLAYDQVQHQLDWHLNQVSSLKSQQQRTQEEQSIVAKDVAQLERDIQKSREELRQANALLNGFPLEELQSQVSHWETTSAVAARAYQEVEARLVEQQESLNKNELQRTSLQKRFESLGVNLEVLGNDRARLQEAERNLLIKIEDLRIKIEPAEKEIQRAEKEYSRLLEVESATQQALSVAERYANQAQMENTRQREAVENLQRRIEEDFGLVALEYEDDVTGQSPLPLEGMVEQLPMIPEIHPDLDNNISRLRAQMRRMGPINPEAQAEYEEVHQRYDFMTTQVSDLRVADTDLREVIGELDELMKREFRRTFEAVAEEFRGMFTRLFGGGSARLVLLEADNPNETGIEIETRLPGRREQGLSLLSGGERSLTASALVFSLLKVSPTPFCVLDEVDAMLDEANVGRFRELLRELSSYTQFIVITHNRNTVQAAGVIYGVTMGRDSASQVISLKMDEVPEEMVK